MMTVEPVRDVFTVVSPLSLNYRLVVLSHCEGASRKQVVYEIPKYLFIIYPAVSKTQAPLLCCVVAFPPPPTTHRTLGGTSKVNIKMQSILSYRSFSPCKYNSKTNITTDPNIWKFNVKYI